jgi:hypothetical protein
LESYGEALPPRVAFVLLAGDFSTNASNAARATSIPTILAAIQVNRRLIALPPMACRERKPTIPKRLRFLDGKPDATYIGANI